MRVAPGVVPYAREKPPMKRWPRQGAAARPNCAPSSGSVRRSVRIATQDLAHRHEQRRDGRGQVSRLLRGNAHLVDHDCSQPSPLSAVLVRPCGAGEDELAQQRSDASDGRLLGPRGELGDESAQ